MKILREPLFHFAVFGALIFAWFALLNPADEDVVELDTIVLDEQDIARLSEQFQITWRRPPSEDEMARLVDNWVRQEVLVREAKNLGMDRGDSVIRNRLVQKMDFLNTSIAKSVTPSDADLEKHLAGNGERFRIGGMLAFEQAYLGANPSEEAVEVAKTALSEGADPSEVGERSLIPSTLSLASDKKVDAAFGNGFYEAISGFPTQAWEGPVRSGYGLHLVRVTESVPERVPELDEIRDKVALDWQREASEELSEAQFQQLLKGYDVRLPDMSGGDSQ